eukprot:579993-Prorocentrum_minimum.AAC.2
MRGVPTRLATTALPKTIALLRQLLHVYEDPRSLKESKPSKSVSAITTSTCEANWIKVIGVEGKGWLLSSKSYRCTAIMDSFLVLASRDNHRCRPLTAL